MKLKPVDQHSLFEARALKVFPDQERFVAGIELSICFAFTSFAERTWIPFVMEEDGKLIGAVTLSVPRQNATRVNMSGFFVAREFQNRGFGQVAMKLVEEEARMRWPSIEELTLLVHPENISARRLYEKNGFLPTDTFFKGEQVFIKPMVA